MTVGTRRRVELAASPRCAPDPFIDLGWTTDRSSAAPTDHLAAARGCRGVPGPRKSRVLAGQQACEGSFGIASVVP